MKIREAAEKVGMPASTIRYYEKVGLLEPIQRVSGKRVFDKNVLFTLEFIKLAQSAGFSIQEIGSLIEAYANDSSPGGAWLVLARNKRENVREKMHELAQIENVLTELLSCQCKSLTECVKKGTSRRASQSGSRG